MTWNTGDSILGTGGTRVDVCREADVIFTALFIGATHFQNRKSKGSFWRVDMEPNTDEKRTRDARTEDDRQSMKALNDSCSKVNHILWNWRGRKEGGLQWGFTPVFSRGRMIAAGQGAADEYARINSEYAETAYRYLTAPQHAAELNQRQEDMYIGRGAYCGIVMDDEGYVVSAMSTIRTTLNEQTDNAGDRWRPPIHADIRAAQYKDAAAATTVWGVIDSNETQEKSRQEGMRFYPRQPNGEPVAPDVANDIVGYTHGMIRSIYETKRIGKGHAFEMSIGTATYKLASCMSCSAFMMANGLDASSTHIGRGESWAPYYSGESHHPSPLAENVTLEESISLCNANHAAFMHSALKDGVAAMLASPTWVSKTHWHALVKLDERLKSKAGCDNTVARDLYLDAMTVHRGDLSRVDSALTIPTDYVDVCERLDWFAGPDEYKARWRNWENIFSDEEVKALHTAPESLVKRYQLTVEPVNSGNLEYWFKDENGKVRVDGKLVLATDQSKGLTRGVDEFTLNRMANIEAWTVKIGAENNYGNIRLNQNTSIGPGKPSYIVKVLSE